MKEWQLALENVFREAQGKLIRFEKPCTVTPNKTLEEIELLRIDRIKDAKKLIEDIKKELSKESGDWADYTPRSQEEEKQIIKKLLTHIYKVEEVNRMTGPPKIPAQMTTALLDRLLHHCHVINIKGRSYRLKELEKVLK